MEFGNWKVTGDTIEWKGDPLQRFVIPIEKLNTVVDKGEQKYYEWILLATDEDWLTQNDLYDLNYAFVYAVGQAGLEFNYEIFDETLANQYDQFEAEDEEDFTLN